jgi:hypothetical protein
MGADPQTGAASALTVQLLAWLAREPRTYAEAMDVWRTSCPQLSVWEDAIADDFVEVVRTRNESHARVTARGTAVLAEAGALVT